MTKILRHSALIYNPKSGRHVATRVLPMVLTALRDAGYQVEPIATRAPGDATRLTREAVAEAQVEVVFAMGGDGTLREVARGLLGSEVAMGLLPTGTTNVMALTLSLPGNALDAAKALSRCTRQEMDVGLADEEPFLMLASSGLDAAVMSQQNSAAKKRFGKAAVAWTGVRQWAAYDYPQIELRLGDRIEHVSYFAACNIPNYAGAFQMAPAASWSDGLLDLVLFRGMGRFETLAFARDLALGRHLRRADVDLQRVETLEIVAPRECLIQLDGDVLDATAPLRLRLAETRLWILAPDTGT